MRLIPLPLPLLLLIYSSFSNRVLAKPELALPFGDPSAGPCISQGDQTAINKLFSDGGPGKKVKICPGTTLKLSGPIIFTGKDQELSTEGYPTDDSRAKLVLVEDAVTAVQGDCRRCARVSILNLQIDGSRATLGRALPETPDGPLVVLGNNEGQRVEHSILRDPRGWAAIHIREGDGLRCKGARVVGNEIGPSGEEWIEALDGPDPESSPLGKPLGDGISLSCRESVVSHNVFTDTTNSAIAIFGSPFSTISHNKITSRSLPQMGGILLIDPSPFPESYTSTIVSHNTIDALAFPIRVAIGIGPPVWSDDTETIIHSGIVRENVLRGYWMGYGVVVSGAKNFTVVENVSTARHSGLRGERCPGGLEGEKENSPPMAFLKDGKTAEGEFQLDFVNGQIQYVVCIDPEPEFDDEDTLNQNNRPKPLAPGPDSDEPPSSEDDSTFPLFPSDPDREPSVVDTIFSHSETRILEALGAVQSEINAFALYKMECDRALAGGKEKELGEGVILSALSGLSTRIGNLEAERKHLRLTIDGLRGELEALGTNMDAFESRETSTLSEVLGLLSTNPPLPPPPPYQAPSPASPNSPPPSNQHLPPSTPYFNNAQRAISRALGSSPPSPRGAGEDGDQRRGWGTWLCLGLAQGVVGCGWWAWGRWRRRRKEVKML